MLKHYITTAWRNLNKYRLFTVINVGGLALGLAAFWAIAMYVGDELSYDKYLPNANRVVRAVSYMDWDGGHLHTATTSPPFAAALQSMLPEVETVVRIDPEGGGIINLGEKHFDVEDFPIVDSTFFKVFPYRFIAGDPARALSIPEAVVLTESLAGKLFGDPAIALGKTIRLGDSSLLFVTGVIEDVPENTHFRFSAVRRWPRQDETGSWQYFNIYTYLLLKKGAEVKKTEALIAKTFSPFFLSTIGGHAQFRMQLQPLTAIHLHSGLDFELSRNGDIRYIYVFIAAAILILGIAVINYMNLSTARSSTRAKEVGIRKAIGSSRGPLIGLFLSEAVIITLVSAMLGLLFLELLLPLFNDLSGKNLSLLRFRLGSTVGLVLGFALLIGLGSGTYPAFMLSGFRILTSLKGNAGPGRGSNALRRVLVTFQFVVTIVMISASCLVYLQLRYMGTADLGFNKDQTLTFHIHDHGVRRQLQALRSRLLESPLIEGVSGASNPIGNNNIGGRNYHFEEDGERKKGSMKGNILQVDRFFLGTLEIPLESGRNFEESMPSDSAGGVIVNEAFVRQAGWTDPIGKQISYYMNDQGDLQEATVVGVTRDFNIYSMQFPIAPLAMYLPQVPDDQDNLYVRLQKGHIPEALDYLVKTYKIFDPSATPDFHFLDQNFSRQYAAERRQGLVLLSFTILAVVLACLGLFGLVNFSASRRVKEIGIRKVLGAGNWGIMRLLAGDLLRLVVIAGLLAAPLAWWAMDKWLQGFAFRIPVHWWVLAGAGVTAAGIALGTMFTQAHKAAAANPVDALKCE